MKYEKGNKPEDQGPRTRLMDSAISLFAEKGYASTSVREIVGRAGVTKPVLYYYFKNKEGIFYAILRWAGEMQEQILGRVLTTPGTMMDRLIRLNRGIYEGLMEHRDLFRMIHNLVFGPPQGAPPFDVEQFHRRIAGAIKAIYMDGRALGEVRDVEPEAVVQLVIGLTDFCFHLDHLSPEAMDPARPERLLRLAFEGLAAKDNR